MTLAIFLIQCLNALQYGLLLFLVASGLTLIFGIMGVINLAHGSFYMIGAYMAFSLAPLFGGLNRLTGGELTTAAMWRMVGASVVVTATQVPLLTDAGELTCMRRGQAVLDALTRFGLPVRGRRSCRLGKPCLV